MAGKISELSALTAAQAARGDQFEIRDVSAGTTGSKSITMQEVSKFLGHGVNVKDYGAVGDGVTNDSAAFVAAIAAVSTGGNASDGGKIFCPRATYKLNDFLDIKVQIHFKGEGALGNYSTRLLFADGKGIRIFHATDSDTGTDGSWSSIRDIAIDSVANTIVAHGIKITAHGVSLENIDVNGFGGNAVDIVAPAGNANLWVIYNARLTGSIGHGLYVSGADANAGIATMVDCSFNGGWGIYDNSFLGNTYIACHTADNTLGAYKSSGGAGTSLFLGCYSEGGQPASDIAYPSISLGGLHGAGFITGNTGAILSGNASGLRCDRAFVSLITSGANSLTASLGGDFASGTILAAGHNLHSDNSSRLRFEGKDIIWDWANLGISETFRITGYETTRQFGRGAIEKYAFETDRLFLGSDDGARWVTMANAAPVGGAHGIGEIVFNSAVAVGQPNGWRCTVAGTPGTWVAMANL